MPNDFEAGPEPLLDIGRALELLTGAGGHVGPALESVRRSASVLNADGPPLTLGAAAVFDAAYRAEASGLTGIDVLARANAAALSFLDLVPDAVLAATGGLPVPVIAGPHSR